MKKKLTALLLALSIVLALSACTSGDPSNTRTPL